MTPLTTDTQLQTRADARKASVRDLRPARVGQSDQGNRPGRSWRDQVEVERTIGVESSAPDTVDGAPTQGGILTSSTQALSVFSAQVLAQDEASQPAADARRRQTAAGVSAYRRAGAAPEIYPDQATLFRVSV